MSENGENGDKPDESKKEGLNWVLLGLGTLMIGGLIFLADKFVILAPRFEEPKETKEEESVGGW